MKTVLIQELKCKEIPVTKMDTTKISEIIRIAFDYEKPSLLLETNWYFLTAIITLLLIWFIIRKKINNWGKWYEMEVEISGSPKAKFKIKRNTENLYVANRIYIELITRKAALPIDEKNDVISEIYNSWYNLFNIIRDEIKTLPGEYLKNHDPTKALIGLTTKILNEGLRPHLTIHQAKYRKWLENELKNKESNKLSPQEIQRKYPNYKELISSMKNVNTLLIKYSKELNKLIEGK